LIVQGNAIVLYIKALYYKAVRGSGWEVEGYQMCYRTKRKKKSGNDFNPFQVMVISSSVRNGRRSSAAPWWRKVRGEGHL